jgi:hypothetical protein
MAGPLKRRRAWLAAGAMLLGPPALTAQDGPEARIWLDRGEEPVFSRGESARLYYRASDDAFVAIFQIDTNGAVRLVFPRSPDEANLVRGGFDYRLLFPRSPFWQVDDDPGVGYFFMVASPRPLDFSAFGYSHFDHGWDLSRIGREVYGDPFVAMDDFVSVLLPEWQGVPYALDFVTYNVGGRHEYPRFLCYDCHGFRPYSAWNPYAYDCASFRVLIYEDPYYYPATRYSGSRVVYVRPTRPFEPRFAFKERAAGEPSAPLFLSDVERRSPAAGPSGPSQRGLSPMLDARPPEVRPPAAGPDSRTRPVLQPRPAAEPGRSGPPPPADPPRPAETGPGRAAPPPARPATPPPSTASPPPGAAGPPSGAAPPPPAPIRPPPGGRAQFQPSAAVTIAIQASPGDRER